ncbi:MAG: hypothetical protein H0W42_09390 [Gemmatimonadaceae bacterium]|nr:hypothetical protein [Gemmatimonadaceae bacterium]
MPSLRGCLRSACYRTSKPGSGGHTVPSADRPGKDIPPETLGSSNAIGGPAPGTVPLAQPQPACERTGNAEAGPSKGTPVSKYLLRLFVTGTSSRTGTAIANLRRICEQELRGQYDLEIIDVLQFPDVAEDEKILATPTLIKSLPLPLRRVIGDLSDKEKVLLGLEVRPVGAGNTDGVES